MSTEILRFELASSHVLSLCLLDTQVEKVVGMSLGCSGVIWVRKVGCSFEVIEIPIRTPLLDRN